MGETIFFAGIYGVGKSTLCENISNITKIPFYSASDLISDINGEKYGATKSVSDKNINQKILIKSVKQKLSQNNSILLAGHFCILDKKNQIEYLPEFVFQELNISKIILLEADIQKIIHNLSSRDNKIYTPELIEALMKSESLQAFKVSQYLNIPLIVHRMQFDNSDIQSIRSVFQSQGD